MRQEDFSKLEAIQQHIEDAVYSDYSTALQRIYEELVQLNGWKSFSGKMMAEAKQLVNKQRVEAYQSVTSDPSLSNQIFSPSVLKEYIAARCHEAQYQYDFAERVNSAIGYSIESLRSILSASKTELTTIGYSQ